MFDDIEVTFSMMFDNFGRHVGAPRVTFRDSVLKWGSQGPPEQKKPKKRPRSREVGIPGGSLLGAFWRKLFKMEFLLSGVW